MVAPVNWRLISHPLNWLIVFVVLMIASFGFKELKEAVSTDCGCNSQPD